MARTSLAERMTRLDQQKARIAEQEAKLKTDERKQRTRRRWESVDRAGSGGRGPCLSREDTATAPRALLRRAAFYMADVAEGLV